MFQTISGYRHNSPNVAFSTFALVGALMSMGFVSEASGGQAVGCYTGFHCSHVTDVVVDNGNGTWTYNFTVFNDSTSYGGVEPRIRDWELPYFTDAGITNVISPGSANWHSTIETVGIPNINTGWDGTAAWQDPSDLWYQGPDSPFTGVTKVLHWYTLLSEAAIPMQQSLSGFGFIANYGPTPAPYQASWIDLPIRTGDPAFPLTGLPNSPTLQGSSVPEPGTLALCGLGLAGLVGLARKKTLS